MGSSKPSRRAFFAGALGLGVGCKPMRNAHRTQKEKRAMSDRMPVLFVAHGAPPLLDDAVWVSQLRSWADQLPLPSAVLMLSAHWVEGPLALGATEMVPLVYDFYGFPKKYYEVTYPAPGAASLADRLERMTARSRRTRRGLDHGAYIPLKAMYPDANVPVLQISLPTQDPEALFEFGQTLAPLRDEGVLIVGSGFLTHNLMLADLRGTSAPPAWAMEFDEWVKDALVRRDVDALVGFQHKAPYVRTALPTVEHYVPVLVALGASVSTSEPVRFPIEGFAFGSMTKRSVQFG